MQWLEWRVQNKCGEGVSSRDAGHHGNVGSHHSECLGGGAEWCAGFAFDLLLAVLRNRLSLVQALQVAVHALIEAVVLDDGEVHAVVVLQDVPGGLDGTLEGRGIDDCPQEGGRKSLSVMSDGNEEGAGGERPPSVRDGLEASLPEVRSDTRICAGWPVHSDASPGLCFAFRL